MLSDVRELLKDERRLVRLKSFRTPFCGCRCACGEDDECCAADAGDVGVRKLSARSLLSKLSGCFLFAKLSARSLFASLSDRSASGKLSVRSLAGSHMLYWGYCCCSFGGVFVG